jgi:hypothetical protein
MNKPVTMKVLVTVNDFSQFDACTLCFSSLRVGWPTANIHIYVNGAKYYAEVVSKLAKHFADYYTDKPVGLSTCCLNNVVLLGDWIREQTQQQYPGPLVIADPDIVYWKSCEDWDFDSETLLAGYFHPRMWNDFSKCVSVERIHTSMMVFPDTARLATTILNAYPLAHQRHGEYVPCDAFNSRVMFQGGTPTWWDVCSNLYNLLPPKAICHFAQEHKVCYDHLNSPSSYQAMTERLEGDHRKGFIFAHKYWVENPTPGLWPMVDAYYKQKAIEGWVRQPEDRTLKV